MSKKKIKGFRVKLGDNQYSNDLYTFGPLNIEDSTGRLPGGLRGINTKEEDESIVFFSLITPTSTTESINITLDISSIPNNRRNNIIVSLRQGIDNEDIISKNFELIEKNSFYNWEINNNNFIFTRTFTDNVYQIQIKIEILPLYNLGRNAVAIGTNTLASGSSSNAEGYYTIASGDYSHAEGDSTTASRAGSHAEGYDTAASGLYSHAEGRETTASGNNSHAEGDNTQASGIASHAEGKDTTASRYYSHAEGSRTTASGDYSHAEGYTTTTSELASHAEGHTTTASGLASHAEGGVTTASGLASHAEGNITTASGNNSHAQNLGTIAVSDNQTALGKYNIEDSNDIYAVIIGNGSSNNNRSNALAVDWNGNIITNGQLVNLQGNSIYNNNLKNLVDSSSEGSLRSIGSAEERDKILIISDPVSCRSYDSISINIDISTIPDNLEIRNNLIVSVNIYETTDANIFTEVDNNDDGLYSWEITDDLLTFVYDGSSVESEDKDIYIKIKVEISDNYVYHLGLNAFAEGLNTKASGNYSHAEGNNTIASGNVSHAEGQNTTAFGNLSHAEGRGTIAFGNYSHTEGSYIEGREYSYHLTRLESNRYSLDSPLGYVIRAGHIIYCESIKKYDIIKDISNDRLTITTVYTNFNSIPENTLCEIYYNKTIAFGYASHAEGLGTVASNLASHAEGYSTIASGYRSHAEGGYTIASESNSHAEGYETKASGGYSHAEGNNTTASGDYSHAEGYNTTASGDYSHAEGNFTTASGDYSHAEGRETTASGDYSHAEGYNTTASGDYSHAEGSRTTASGDYSHAQNYRTIAASNYQTVLGRYNIEDSNNEYAVIIGNGTTNNARSNALTVDWNGNVEITGQIKNLNGLIAYKDITVPAAVNANTGTTKFASVTIPDGYQLIGVAVINKPAAGTYHAQAIYIGSTSTPIGVSIYNASSENVISGTVIARVYMIKTTFLTVLTD